LTAGTQVPSDLSINGNLSVNGIGKGDGGSITLTTFTQETFQLFGVTTSNGGGNGGGNGNGNNQESEAGVFGLLSADAGSAFGNGGSITVINTGVGGIVLGPNQPISVAPAATGGNGGLINLQA